MTMTNGWVAEQISTDHTIVPDLTGASPTPSNDFADEFATLFTAPPTATEADVAMSEPKGGWPVGRVVAFAAAAAVVAAGALFAWPYVADLLVEPEEVVAAAPTPVGTPTQRFVIDGETMYLEGSVPDSATSAIIERAAQQALGADRVVNNFEISDTAVFDPSKPVQLTVAETVLFSTGRADVNDEYTGLIDLAVELMTSQSTAVLTIVGHTDDVGAEDVNLRLSIDRATAVAAQLNERGVPPERMIVTGRGEAEPLALNDTPEGRSVNRRVEFLITGLLG
ncbi:MAG: OmpA family protein [Acidimicrobiia bacterium]|nr:OmpA family protein [Acidimicrobiia bacterium]